MAIDPIAIGKCCGFGNAVGLLAEPVRLSPQTFHEFAPSPAVALWSRQEEANYLGVPRIILRSVRVPIRNRR